MNTSSALVIWTECERFAAGQCQGRKTFISRRFSVEDMKHKLCLKNISIRCVDEQSTKIVVCVENPFTFSNICSSENYRFSVDSFLFALTSTGSKVPF